MVSKLLSTAFGIVGFMVFFFGFGAGWEVALGIAVVTAIGLWAGDRSTTTRVARKETPTRATHTTRQRAHAGGTVNG